MSLINRIALCNFSNAEGEDSDNWNPRFRYEILDFRGQSAVVNLANGGGKTTSANAVIGLLSRHPTLLARAKEHAAPRKVGYWSHIQVELIEPLHGGMPRDMFTEAGEQVPGETWVFGMTLSRDGDSNDYYYYPGRLEDLAPGLRNKDELKLIRNEDFREQSKQVKGAEWGVTRENWRNKIGQHIPIETLLGLAEFQIKGGADKDAPIFKLAQLKKGAHLDEIFFYEILAPELLHDVLDDNEGEESSSIDQALYRIIRDVVNTRHRLTEQQEKVNEMSQAMEYLREASELGKAAKQADAAYVTQRRERALDIAVLENLVRNRPVPGVPKASLPEGKLGEVAARLVMVPGKSAPRITDNGLAIVLGIESKRVNENARRMSILGRKITQVIEIPCDLAISSERSGGHRSCVYTIEQATDLLRKYADVGARELFEDAISWFENEADTNPLRQALMESEVDQSEAIKVFSKESSLIESLQAKSLELAGAQTQAQADQAALDELNASGLFTEDELKNPAATAKQVEQAFEDAEQTLADFEKMKARLTDYIDDWNCYRDRFNEEMPSDVNERLSTNEQSAKNAVASNQDLINTIEQNASKCKEKINELEKEISLGENKLESLQILQASGRPILDELEEGESPVGLEKSRRNAKTEAKDALYQCQQELELVEKGVQAIDLFHENYPSVDPAIWIDETNQERNKLTISQSNLTSMRKGLLRQRKALDTNPVAANEIAQDGLNCLDKGDISYQPLHNFILTLGLSEQRNQDLLGMFSSLLFAPVIELPVESLRAAALIEKAELPVPVFSAKSLTEFCQGCVIVELDNLGRTGLIAGQVTRQVKCLLDPSLVDREKAELEQKIEKIKSKLTTVEDRLDEISPEGDLVQKARAAATAVSAGYPDKLEALRTHFNECKNEADHCDSLLTDEMVDALRAAEMYYKQGGDEQADLLMEVLAENRGGFEAAETRSEKLNSERIRLYDLVPELNEAANQAYPAETRNLVNRITLFIKLEGPEFMGNEKAASEKLNNAKQLATDRADYKLYFPRAIRWLKYQHTLETGDDIDVQIEKNNEDVESANARSKKAKEIIERLRDQLPSQRECVRAIDLVAIALILKFKRAMTVIEEPQESGITEDDINSHPIGDAAWKFSESLGLENTDILDSADLLARILDEYNVDAELEQVKRLYGTKKNAIKNFVNKANEASRVKKGLSEVEREQLRQVSDVSDATWLDQFAEKYWQLYIKDENELERLNTDEGLVNQNFAGRLALLMEAACDNLAALRSVASKDPEGVVSHFEVNAKVTPREGMTEIIDRIVDLVDVHETRRREDEEHNRPVEQADKAKVELQANIRETLYRSVFYNVSVKYANEEIRPDRKAHRFGKDLSTGEKNALLLMWVLRLAQYRIEREARRRITSLSRRRMRNQAQSIMIIDGLFSNLTKPKLIRSVMSSLTVTRGHFQLIGLVHDPKYQHDFDLFPVFLMGNSQNDQSWVSFDHVDKTGALAFAKLVKKPAHGVT